MNRTRKEVWVLLTLLFFSNLTEGQTSMELSKNGDSLYRAKNFVVAATFYLHAAEKDELRSLRQSNYYNAACCYALSGKADSALHYLKLSFSNGNKDVSHLKEDADLVSLHALPQWGQFINSLGNLSTSTSDPRKARLITTDIMNFWNAYDLAQKDTAHRSEIYKKYYLDIGTDGLQDYFAYKIKSMKNFVAAHDKKANFYAAIRKNTLTVEDQKPKMIGSFEKFKLLYPEARFPDIYFVIGAFTSGGTSTGNGLLIGLDQTSRSPDIPLDELNLWERNNFNDIDRLPSLIAHELIHFNQGGMADDTTLLHAVLIEGMADFIGELISGATANQRLHTWAKGKEKHIWESFEKEMYLDRARNWIANSEQETADKPADLGYWVGYQICKAYYDKSPDKKQAIYDMLNIKDYKGFYEKSGASAISTSLPH
jgi:hypothetical protein